MAKEHRISATTHVAAPRDVVWSFLCDLDRYDEWIESTIELYETSGPARLGATFVERARLSGFFQATIHWTVVEFDAGRAMTFAGTGVWAVEHLGFSAEVTEADGDCEFTLTLWYTPRFGPLGTVIEFAVGSNVFAEQRRSAKTFAIVAERELGDGART